MADNTTGRISVKTLLTERTDLTRRADALDAQLQLDSILNETLKNPELQGLLKQREDLSVKDENETDSPVKIQDQKNLIELNDKILALQKKLMSASPALENNLAVRFGLRMALKKTNEALKPFDEAVAKEQQAQAALDAALKVGNPEKIEEAASALEYLLVGIGCFLEENSSRSLKCSMLVIDSIPLELNPK